MWIGERFPVVGFTVQRSRLAEEEAIGMNRNPRNPEPEWLRFRGTDRLRD